MKTICRTMFSVLCVLMWLAMSSSSGAQSVDDLLKEMDAPQGKGEGPADSEKTRSETKKKRDSYLDQLGKNLHGSVRLRTTQFFRPPQEREGADMSNTFGNSLVKVTNKFGSDNWDLNLGALGEVGTEVKTYAGTFFDEFVQDSDRRRRYLDLNEIFLNVAASSDLNIVVGKKTLTTGISTLFIPSDRMRPQDLNDPLDPKDLNRFQLRADYFWEATTFTAAFLPIYQEPKLPSESSRWMGQRKSGDVNSGDIYDAGNLGMEIDRPKITDTNFGYFGRVKTTHKGWDFFASYYHGPNPYYVIREETRPTATPGVNETIKIKEVIKVDTLAFGFSTTSGPWEYHGEALYNYSFNRRDDNYISYVGGFTYTVDDLAKRIGLEKIDITAEYANEIITERQGADNYTSSSRRSRAGRNDIFSRINMEYNNKLSFQFLCNFILTTNETGRFQKFVAKYKLRDGLISRLSMELFGGHDDSLYGRWSQNDRVLLDFEYSF